MTRKNRKGGRLYIVVVKKVISLVKSIKIDIMKNND